jgi:hypothetical protein
MVVRGLMFWPGMTTVNAFPELVGASLLLGPSLLAGVVLLFVVFGWWAVLLAVGFIPVMLVTLFMWTVALAGGI